jgi:Holliday junction resolvase RusA-like endonuclease
MRNFPSGGMAHSNFRKVLGFRSDVATAWGHQPMLHGAIALECTFVFERPSSHYLPINRRRTAAILREDAPVFHVQRPDVDKLLRGVMDALTGRAYADDEQVVFVTGSKEWDDEPATIIEVREA